MATRVDDINMTTMMIAANLIGLLDCDWPSVPGPLLEETLEVPDPISIVDGMVYYF
jgi:hypothetical protein